jgi:hypothetical protein
LLVSGQISADVIDDGMLVDSDFLAIGLPYFYSWGHGSNARSGTEFTSSISGAGTVKVQTGATISLEAPTEDGHLTYWMGGSATAIIESTIGAGNSIDLENGSNTLVINDQYYIQENPSAIFGESPNITSNTPIVDASIINFQESDRLIFIDDALTGSVITSATYQNNVLSLLNAGSVVSVFNIISAQQSCTVLVGLPSASPYYSGTQQTINLQLQDVSCFCPGAQISTPTGSTPIECLQRGDAITAIGARSAKIEWIGSRKIDFDINPRLAGKRPVLVTPHTFEDGQPSHPLLLSPDHGVYTDGVIIPIKYLINDDSIIQTKMRSAIYYHIKLLSHDIILANCLPCETFLGDINKFHAFWNADNSVHREMQDYGSLWETEGYAPLVIAGAQITRVRDRLKERARKMPLSAKASADLPVY